MKTHCNHNKLVLLYILVFLVISCDPGDSRLKVKNLSDEPIFVMYYHDTLLPPEKLCPKVSYIKGMDTITYNNCSSRIVSDTTIPLYIRTFRAWEKYINDQCTDQKVRIFIFSDSVMNYVPWDTIKKRNLFLKRYDLSLDSIKRMDWVITYPPY